ncbi:MAG: hypothetical protein AMS14_04125 [Planctomycetes bacterium DG_20]|nr:MAG: hypothetical protein AMS14_04125 [Planctomycetes bacterium DG_20]
MPQSGGGNIKTYRDLVAWQKAISLAEIVYGATRDFPETERFGLVSQMRRAAVSVPANIAEGHGRGRKAEFRRFLGIARGSLFELQTHAELARRLGWLRGDSLNEVRERCHEVDAVLAGLIRAVDKWTA